MAKKLAVDLMLDSGAYSAWNQGAEINIKDYVGFLKRNLDFLWSYVVLDVLPEGKESMRTPEANERGAKKSYKNLQIMKDAGLSSIPVFHQGERFNWLEQLLKDEEPYIGISTRKDLWSKASKQREWLDQVFSIIADAKGRPIVKTHGFGITSVHNLSRYPWFTTDSTTWSMSAGYGTVYCPVKTHQGFDYSRPPILVTMSQRERTKEASPKWRNSRRGHFISHGPHVQGFVREFIEDVVGVSMEEVRDDSEARRRANLVYFKNYAETVPLPSFKARRSNVQCPDPSRLRLWTHLKIMFATSIKNKSWGHLMNDVDARTRLISYYELRKSPDELLRKYVTDGIIETGEKRGRKKTGTAVEAAAGN